MLNFNIYDLTYLFTLNDRCELLFLDFLIADESYVRDDWSLKHLKGDGDTAIDIAAIRSHITKKP